MKYIYSLLLALLICPTAFAQWQTVAAFGQKVTVPNGMLVRYGSEKDNLWTAPKIFTNLSFTVNSAVFPTNPDPGAQQSTFVIQAYILPVAQTMIVANAVVPVSLAVAAPAVSGTAAYCGSGKAKSININVTTTPATGLIAQGSGCSCN